MPTMTQTDISDQIRQTFPFDVDKFPLRGPDNMNTPFYGLFRSDTLECVGNAVKEGYEPHTIDDVCALAEAGAAAFGGTHEVRSAWREGHFLTIAPSEDRQREMWDEHYQGKMMNSKSDVCIPRLIIRASYDGRAFRAQFGMFRLVCRNLMSIPVKRKYISLSIRHTAALRTKMPSLIEDFQTVINQSENIYNAIDNAKQRQVNMADFIREVYPINEDASKNARGRAERRVEAIMSRLYRDRNGLGVDVPSDDGSGIPQSRRATAWEAYNAVQGYVQHDAPRHKNPSDIDRAIMALEDKSVDKAALLAFV